MLLTSAPDPGALLQRADVLIEKGTRASQLKGAKMLLATHKVRPGEVTTMSAVARAWFLRALWSKDLQRKERASNRGIRASRALVKAFPDRAEGYYWASINYGMKAQAVGVVRAVSEGLANRIEKNGLRALKRNPRLYGGAVQRMLGRYYYLVPWPMQKLERSLTLLEQSYKADPKHPATQLYLAEVLLASGHDKRALGLLRTCSTARNHTDPEAIPTCRQRLLDMN
ncbi:MAG: hypothetical protein ACI9WU_005242 [Myxococcota bacterium]|jgi:hypothetical protein